MLIKPNNSHLYYYMMYPSKLGLPVLSNRLGIQTIYGNLVIALGNRLGIL